MNLQLFSRSIRELTHLLTQSAVSFDPQDCSAPKTGSWLTSNRLIWGSNKKDEPFDFGFLFDQGSQLRLKPYLVLSVTDGFFLKSQYSRSQAPPAPVTW